MERKKLLEVIANQKVSDDRMEEMLKAYGDKIVLLEEEILVLKKALKDKEDKGATLSWGYSEAIGTLSLKEELEKALENKDTLLF